MDRQITYPTAEVLDTDILLTNKNAMIGLGYLAQAVLGSTTVVDGLACSATTPASMGVNVATGSIYSLAQIDATAYGSVNADTVNQIVKQGIAIGTSNFNCPAPGTAGQSVVYLVQARYQDVDGGSTNLPFVSATDGSVTYTMENTVRQGKCVLSLKTGTAAASGSQVTPTPDAGYVGLWAITVANGAATITGANIAQYPGAPFLKAKMPSLPASIRPQLTANTTFYVATTGSDSNSGLSASTPFLTIQKAINTIMALDLNGYTATISVADGTYGGFAVSSPIIGGSLQITGDVTTPANCVISSISSSCVTATNGAIFSIGGFSLTSSGSGAGIVATNNGIVTINGNMNFGSIAQSGMTTSDHGKIYITASYTINGNAVSHWDSERFGMIWVFSAATISLAGSPAWSTAFATVLNQGLIFAPSGVASFSGAATGSRYAASSNGLIQTNGGGTSFFPGSTSGSTSAQGQYL